MTRHIALFTKRLFVSKRNGKVREIVTVGFTSALLLSSIILFLQVVLILLGIGDIFVPLASGLRDALSGIVY